MVRRLRESVGNIKYVQSTVTNWGTPIIDEFSGSGGRSFVTPNADSIDTWDVAEDAVEDGNTSYKKGVHWGVFEMDINSRQILKLVYDSKHGYC